MEAWRSDKAKAQYVLAVRLDLTPGVFSKGTITHHARPYPPGTPQIQSWLGKIEQGDKWSFCLMAAMMACEQERRL